MNKFAEDVLSRSTVKLASIADVFSKGSLLSRAALSSALGSVAFPLLHPIFSGIAKNNYEGDSSKGVLASIADSYRDESIIDNALSGALRVGLAGTAGSYALNNLRPHTASQPSGLPELLYGLALGSAAVSPALGLTDNKYTRAPSNELFVDPEDNAVSWTDLRSPKGEYTNDPEGNPYLYDYVYYPEEHSVAFNTENSNYDIVNAADPIDLQLTDEEAEQFKSTFGLDKLVSN